MKKITEQFSATILVVDDYKLNLELVQSLLELMGCTVHTAASGPEALDRASKIDYDMVFMDIQMPGMDGVKTAEAMRKFLRKETPIVALTAHAIEGDKEKFLSSGLDDYVSKPVSGERLAAILARHIQPS